MADEPLDMLGGKTPLEAAATPNMDSLAARGESGLLRTVPAGFPPGSDVANLSILGYDPKKYYTGRAPFEAASIGVKLAPDEVAYRCNLVTLSGTDDGGKPVMNDYSAGHISTAEAKGIVETLDSELKDEGGGGGVRFYPGKSYRHLMVLRDGDNGGGGIHTTPPHDITDKEIEGYLPKGEGAKRVVRLMERSREILKDHPVNRARGEAGSKAANSIWLWGQGKAPEMPTFKEKFSMDGAIISAVDLMNGIGIYAGLEVINVPGATGYLDTNYKGKADYALKALKKKDFVCVHVEAPDEAGHQGFLKDKIRAIEDFDRLVVGRVLEGLEKFKDYRVMAITDHPTPVLLKTHTSDPVPFAIYSNGGGSVMSGGGSGAASFNEKAAIGTGRLVEDPDGFIRDFLEK